MTQTQARRQVRIVKLVRVADKFARLHLEILPAERASVPRGEVGERHLVCAADPGAELMDLAGKAVRRQPLGHGVSVKKRSIDPLGRGTENAMKTDGVRDDSLLLVVHHPLVDRGSGKSICLEHAAVAAGHDVFESGVENIAIVAASNNG